MKFREVRLCLKEQTAIKQMRMQKPRSHGGIPCKFTRNRSSGQPGFHGGVSSMRDAGCRNGFKLRSLEKRIRQDHGCLLRKKKLNSKSEVNEM